MPVQKVKPILVEIGPNIGSPNKKEAHANPIPIIDGKDETLGHLVDLMSSEEATKALRVQNERRNTPLCLAAFVGNVTSWAGEQPNRDQKLKEKEAEKDQTSSDKKEAKDYLVGERDTDKENPMFLVALLGKTDMINADKKDTTEEREALMHGLFRDWTHFLIRLRCTSSRILGIVDETPCCGSSFSDDSIKIKQQLICVSVFKEKLKFEAREPGFSVRNIRVNVSKYGGEGCEASNLLCVVAFECGQIVEDIEGLSGKEQAAKMKKPERPVLMAAGKEERGAISIGNRQPHVYQLMLKGRKKNETLDRIIRQVDDEGNSARHLAASIVGEYKPWRIPGAALRMQ
ncbi:unnamed protein product [Dovyalis caffra]|uniref:Uncharacterized protein n=1 Tax=Dovyalis caffra TaxID=77055 RepID=A0AAV1S808_9ROSI|nr:unnamed protein product [Dovyalis caffra]